MLAILTTLADFAHHAWLDAHHAQDQQLVPLVLQDIIGTHQPQLPTSQH